MISRTVRYFKLIYIVTVILMSNEDICESVVDRIQIAPRSPSETKELQQPHHKKVARGTQKATRHSWLWKLDFFGLSRIKGRLVPLLSAFSFWTLPSYLVNRSSEFISNKFVVSSDCDIIYSR